MKRAVSVCLLAALLLCGCTNSTAVSRNGLTLTLPKQFSDLSDETYAAGTNLLYGYEDLAILGIREDKALLAEHGMVPTLAQYGQMVIDANGLAVTPEETDGFCHFTYEATVENIPCTYLTVILEGPEHFWMLQGYCPKSIFPQNKDLFWSCLASARIDK